MPLPDLAVGLGFRPGTPAETILDALRELLGNNTIDCLATIDRRLGDPALQTVAGLLGVPVHYFTATELSDVPVPNPSPRIEAALGTASVAEAAAILAADGPLVLPKHRIYGVIVAAAARTPRVDDASA